MSTHADSDLANKDAQQAAREPAETPSFPRFPALPAEIRLEIWKHHFASCLPAPKVYRLAGGTPLHPCRYPNCDVGPRGQENDHYRRHRQTMDKSTARAFQVHCPYPNCSVVYWLEKGLKRHERCMYVCATTPSSGPHPLPKSAV